MYHAAFSRLRVVGPRVALSPEGTPFATPEPRGPTLSMWVRMPPPLPPLVHSWRITDAVFPHELTDNAVSCRIAPLQR